MMTDDPRPRRRQISRRAGAVFAANLVGDLPGQQQQIAIEQEEAGQLVVGDDVQLFLKSLPGFVCSPG